VVGPGIFYYLQRAERLVSSMRVMPLTSYLGDLGCASFSPDGSQVAFDWRASNKKNYDVYVRLVRRGNALQLTREQADSLLPTWSPDGSRIAFNRAGSVFLVSTAGRAGEPFDNRSSGGQQHVESGRKVTRLTFPPARAFDSRAAFSQDGTKLAFIRSLGGNRGAGPIYVLPLEAGVPHGEAWRLTSPGSKGYNFKWDAKWPRDYLLQLRRAFRAVADPCRAGCRASCPP
jgi:Tol biopolymer transport system component